MTPENYEKKALKDYFNALGWFYYHNLAGLGAYKGIADFTVIKKGVVVQCEAKKPGGVQSVYQKTFQEDWEAQGGLYVAGDAQVIVDYLENINFLN